MWSRRFVLFISALHFSRGSFRAREYHCEPVDARDGRRISTRPERVTHWIFRNSEFLRCNVREKMGKKLYIYICILAATTIKTSSDPLISLFFKWHIIRIMTQFYECKYDEWCISENRSAWVFFVCKNSLINKNEKLNL